MGQLRLSSLNNRSIKKELRKMKGTRVAVGSVEAWVSMGNMKIEGEGRCK